MPGWGRPGSAEEGQRVLAAEAAAATAATHRLLLLQSPGERLPPPLRPGRTEPGGSKPVNPRLHSHARRQGLRKSSSKGGGGRGPPSGSTLQMAELAGCSRSEGPWRAGGRPRRARRKGSER